MSMELTCRLAQGIADARLVDHINCATSAEITVRLGQGHWSRESNVKGVLRWMRLRETFLVFQGEDAVASFAIDENLPRFWNPKLWCAPDAKALGVFGVAVLPRLQRSGIGTWIMRTIEAMARDREIRFVRLDAYTVNPRSLAFYRKLGYADRGVIPKFGVRCFEKDVTLP